MSDNNTDIDLDDLETTLKRSPDFIAGFKLAKQIIADGLSIESLAHLLEGNLDVSNFTSKLEDVATKITPAHEPMVLKMRVELLERLITQHPDAPEDLIENSKKQIESDNARLHKLGVSVVPEGVTVQ